MTFTTASGLLPAGIAVYVQGHPFSNQAKLTMTFKRPDRGHILFDWVLDDPKTYTRPIKNERVFVLTPDVEVMEYSCMEGNIDNLLEGVVTPWHAPKDQEFLARFQSLFNPLVINQHIEPFWRLRRMEPFRTFRTLHGQRTGICQ